MKLLSFAIPCYNSKDYMEHCIESILPGGDDVEIIIVDDGSKDETAAIADRYAAEYPDIVKAVHQGERWTWRGCKHRSQKCHRQIFQGR